MCVCVVFHNLTVNKVLEDHIEEKDEESISSRDIFGAKLLNMKWKIQFEQCDPLIENKLVHSNMIDKANPIHIYQ